MLFGFECGDLVWVLGCGLLFGKFDEFCGILGILGLELGKLGVCFLQSSLTGPSVRFSLLGLLLRLEICEDKLSIGNHSFNHFEGLVDSSKKVLELWDVDVGLHFAVSFLSFFWSIEVADNV